MNQRPSPHRRPVRRSAIARALLAGWALCHTLVAQNFLPYPPPDGAPPTTGWTLQGDGSAERASSTEAPVYSTRGKGTGSSEWRSDSLVLTAAELYLVRFHGQRSPGASQGTAFAGTDHIHRDFPLTSSWDEGSFVFRQPDLAEKPHARFGQWEVRGQINFRSLYLRPVRAVHRRFEGGLELGEAESLHAGSYRFEPRLGWWGANAHRPLAEQSCGFNSDRFLFGPGTRLVYRFALPGLTQQKAKVRIQINHYEAGALIVEAAADGQGWSTVGQWDGQHRSATLALPAHLFPAHEIRLRLAGDARAELQVNTCDYEAAVSPAAPEADGETRFLEIEQQPSHFAVTPETLNFKPAEGLWESQFSVSNRTTAPLSLSASVRLDHLEPYSLGPRFSLAPGQSTQVSLRATAVLPGLTRLGFEIANANRSQWFKATAAVRLGWPDDPRPGHWLAETDAWHCWWSEAGWKIGRERRVPPPPAQRLPDPIALSAARGEREPVQIILRPKRPLALQGVRLADFRGPDGAPSPLTAHFDAVGYVQVTQPTDESCVAGWYPDPLAPLRLPLELAPERNQPLWLTCFVPTNAAAGVHTGAVEITTAQGTQSLPIRVTVYDFALPPQTHLRTALGLDSGAIYRHHRVSQPDHRRLVYEQYLQNFAEHRISPYSFYDEAPINVRFVEANGQPRAQVDFTRFDLAAKRWLDEARFNTFQLPLQGMGGGTFHSRHLGELAGFKEGSAEHERLFRDYLGQVEAHLREQGWLDRAFTYWFDEPDPKDYAFVIDGMKRLKAAAPGIRRMLTEQPEPALQGHVDIWCALTPEWTPESVRARRDAGEEVWWYICTGPKAPYVTEFIDHPGTELRLWPWQSWQYGVQGLLIWATVYWHSPAAYPDALQDPWQDPMSWVSGYGYQPGQRSPWGNGDGRFLYPPAATSKTDSGPVLEGPVNSLRWECLRDGLEDYEYLWLLDQRVRSATAAQRVEPARLAAARELLTVHYPISGSLTQFTTDPRDVLARRESIARMIESLPAP